MKSLITKYNFVSCSVSCGESFSVLFIPIYGSAQQILTGILSFKCKVKMACVNRNEIKTKQYLFVT